VVDGPQGMDAGWGMILELFVRSADAEPAVDASAPAAAAGG
jgi:hypothetical protein